LLSLKDSADPLCAVRRPPSRSLTPYRVIRCVDVGGLSAQTTTRPGCGVAYEARSPYARVVIVVLVMLIVFSSCVWL